MTPLYLPGFYIDVAVWIDGRLLAVTSDGPIVRCWLEPETDEHGRVSPPLWDRRATEPLLFLRGAVQGGMLLSVNQGHDTGHGWLVNDRMVRDLGPTFGVQPVGIDACSAYVVRSGAGYERVSLVSQSLPSGAPGSSQGLSDVQPDGTLWWADQHRSIVINGITLTYPNQRGRVIVGQVEPPGIAAAVVNVDPTTLRDTWRITRVIDGDAFEPHVAVSPTGRIAICARTPKGAAYVVTTIQELSA